MGESRRRKTIGRESWFEKSKDTSVRNSRTKEAAIPIRSFMKDLAR